MPLGFRTSVTIGTELTREKGYRELTGPTLNSIYSKDTTRNPTCEFHRTNPSRIIIKRTHQIVQGTCVKRVAPTAVQYWARDLASDFRYHGRQQEAPRIARTRLLCSAKASQRREINAHRVLVAMTGAVVVVASVTSSVTHTMIASNIRRSIN